MPSKNQQNGNGDASFRYRRVIDLKGCDNDRFCDIATHWGENLVTFHHRLVSQVVPDVRLHDLSEWISDRGSKAINYYPHFLALFICHGVLFENFVTNGSERVFFQQVVFPALRAVESRLTTPPRKGRASAAKTVFR